MSYENILSQVEQAAAEGRISDSAVDNIRNWLTEARYAEYAVQVESGSVHRANPRPLDLRLLLREGGRNLTEWSEPDLFARGCEHGWTFACPTGS